MVNVKPWITQKRKAKGFSSMMKFMKRKPGRPKKKQTSLTNDDSSIQTIDAAPQRVEQNQLALSASEKIARTNCGFSQIKKKMNAVSRLRAIVRALVRVRV